MILISITTSSSAWSQAPAALQGSLQQAVTAPLERNLPQQAPVSRSELAPLPVGADGDPTPLGVDVKGIRLFGLDSAVVSGAGAGIVVDNVDGVPAAELERALRPFIGRPLSQQLVAQARAAVVTVFRDAGRPFVSVTPPPQEVTSGVLQLQVVPYRLGRVGANDPAATGDGGQDHLARLRARAGSLIDSDQLSEDIDWLNRFPYRHINGVFEPGTRPGETDLTLNVTRQKPWRAYGGYANTGSKATGYDRYFVGFSAGIEALNDLTLSYQLTGSEDLWNSPVRGRLAGDRWPGYISHAGRIAIPTFARQAIEIAPNFVATRQELNGIPKPDRMSYRNTTFELPIVYRSAASNIWADAPSQMEIYGGVSFKWVERVLAFNAMQLGRNDAAAFNMFVGLSRFWRSADGASNSLDARVVVNPGGVLPGNTVRAWSAQSNGQLEKADYVYGLAEFIRSTPLDSIAALKNFSISTSFTGLIGGRTLPDTERLSLGGASAARGYSSGDGAADAGLVLRNELRLPTFSLLTSLARKTEAVPAPQVQDNLSPYLFVDLAYGHNFVDTSWVNQDKKGTTLIGAGAGFDYRIAQNLLASLSGGWALKNADQTERGDFSAMARVSVSY